MIPFAHGNALLEWEFRAGSAPSIPGTYYVGALTTAPDPDGDGTDIVEVSGGSYARQPITFDPAVDNEIVSAADINFPVATAPWGTIKALGIFSAVSGGTCRRVCRDGDFVDVAIDTNDRLELPAGQVSLRYINNP